MQLIKLCVCACVNLRGLGAVGRCVYIHISVWKTEQLKHMCEDWGWISLPFILLCRLTTEI